MFSARKSGAPAGGYPINNSLRFQKASSQYLSRTFVTPTNNKIFTFSSWVKRGALDGTFQFLFDAGASEDYIGFTPSNTMRFLANGVTTVFETTQVFRDPSAWYHIVLSIDSTQATASNRVKLYINGSQVTAFSTTNYPAQNAGFNFNSAVSHKLGTNSTTNNYFFDGYMTEVNFIDGQALTPSSFGETNTLTGQWIAKKYNGTYGTNGFYLPFSNGTSTTTLGADSSGNGNNWTLNNFTRSAGVSDCWMNDVPSGNGGASGTQPNSNYAVLNPLQSLGTYASANLQITTSSTNAQATTVFASSGKWYAEFISTSGTASNTRFGVCNTSGAGADLGGSANGWAYLGDGRIYNNGTATSYGVTYTTNDVLQIALDLDAGKVWYGKNGTWMASGSPSTGANPSQTFTANQLMSFAVASGTGSIVYVANMGQRSFAYTPPSGFKALCTANLPASTIKQGNQYMDASLYNGNSSTQTVTNSGSFQPDMVWMKSRSNAYNNLLHDSSRGVTKLLIPNGTDAEQTVTDGITSFNANGFSLGSNGSYNQTGATYVGWQWKANGGTTVSNTNGSITSTVQVGATQGISIVTYTGTGSAATVGHGLGVAPSMVIVKRRSSAYNWPTYHASFGATKYLYLDSTAAATTDANIWNNTAPTSSVFTIGTSLATNQSTGTYVAYCFAEIAGFSKFGSYTGNGSADGPFIYTGFRPKFFLVKRTDTVESWNIVDTSRNQYNQAGANLYPNLANAESTNNSCDILSNGIKLRNTWAGANANGGTYIYMAFAENPLAQSNAR